MFRENPFFAYLDESKTKGSIWWIVITYVVVSGLWILFSDRIIAAFFTDPAQRLLWSIIKGWLFVVVTGLLLFALISRLTSHMRRGHQTLLATSPIGITIIAPDGKIAIANWRAEEILNLPRKEITQVTYNAPAWHITDISGGPLAPEEVPFARVMATGKPVFDMQLQIQPAGAKAKKISVNAAPVIDKRGRIECVIVVFMDITERLRIEDELRETIREKDRLLHELNHRVNNNLQLISNLVSLQSKSVHDRNAIALLEENQNRIRSIALVQEKLYLTKGISSIKLSDYIADLAQSIMRTFHAQERGIRLRLDVENVELEMEPAVTVGLIINEVVSNSLTHAFPDGRQGEIWISLHCHDTDVVELDIGDNGVGIPEGIDPRKTGTLGMRLLFSLAEKQLEGSIELIRKRGTMYRIRFRNVPASSLTGR
ncbi:MAG: sensor histidine kinase [Deltaproteobacteria bacterium]